MGHKIKKNNMKSTHYAGTWQRAAGRESTSSLKALKIKVLN